MMFSISRGILPERFDRKLLPCDRPHCEQRDALARNLTMDLQLSGKTALIFGGSKGIGRGIADALAAEGVAVAMVARNREVLDRAVSEIKSRGGRAHGFAADLADWPSVQRAVDAARKEL